MAPDAMSRPQAGTKAQARVPNVAREGTVAAPRVSHEVSSSDHVRVRTRADLAWMRTKVTARGLRRSQGTSSVAEALRADGPTLIDLRPGIAS